MKIKRANLFGAELTVTTYAELLQITDELIAKKPNEPYRYNFCNVHVVMMTLENPKLKAAVNHPKALSVTDGMPLVWAIRKLGKIPMEDRVYGPTFFEKALKHRPGDPSALSQRKRKKNLSIRSTPAELTSSGSAWALPSRKYS